MKVKKEIGKNPSGFSAEIIRRSDGSVKVRSGKNIHHYMPSSTGSEYVHVCEGRIVGWVSELPYFDNNGWLLF